MNLVVHRLDSQAKGDVVVRPFARAALYRDDLLAVTAHQGLFLNQLELSILAGGVTERVPACTLSRRCSSPAGGNLKRSELGRGLNYACASCASGPWVKQPWQERSSEYFSWAWPMWRTVVATSLRPIPNTAL